MTTKMKTKSLTIMSLSILSLVIIASLVSASSFTVAPATLSFDSSSSKTFTITNPTPLTPINVDFPSTISIEGENGYVVIFDVTGTKTNIGASSIITIDPQTSIDLSKFNLGESYTSELIVSSGADTRTILVEINSNNYCDVTNNGEIDLSIENLNVNGFSEDDNEWYPRDEVEVEVTVDNNGKEKINNIQVEWCLFDNENKNCVAEDSEKDFDVKDGDDKTITFTFTVDPKDLESDVTDYTLYVRATGEVAAGTYDGEDSCASDSEGIEMKLSDDFVILTNIKTEPTPVACGNQATITADVWNIGNSDEDDVTAELRINDPQLKLSQSQSIGSIDSLKKDHVAFILDIPKETKEKTYTVSIYVTDDNGDIFENDDDGKATFSTQLQVEGSCGPVVKETRVIVAPVLESGGKAGEELVVKVGVTNSGNEVSTFNVDVSGFDDWATGDYSPKTLTLNAGQSGDVTVTLTPNKDAVGKQNFNVEIQASGSTAPARKTVELEITKASGGIKLPGIKAGSFISKDNWYLWGIGLLNVVLVVIIIVVAVRVARS